MRISLLILIVFFTFLVQHVNAQCAMCKTTIVNNVSNGELALAEGLNFGIMYLFFAPYLAFVAIAGVWFYKYRRHGKKLSTGNPTL